jgi:hypothetical protein
VSNLAIEFELSKVVGPGHVLFAESYGKCAVVQHSTVWRPSYLAFKLDGTTATDRRQ